MHISSWLTFRAGYVQIVQLEMKLEIDWALGLVSCPHVSGMNYDQRKIANLVANFSRLWNF